MPSVRERLKIQELAARIFRNRSEADRILAAHVPNADRSCLSTTYGKSAFELSVRTAGLAGGTIILPWFISHDFVEIFHKYDITPVFADVDLDSWQLDLMNIDPGMLDAAGSLVVFHTFGLPADGRTFRDLCDRHQLVLIEDCARAFGARSEDGLEIHLRLESFDFQFQSDPGDHIHIAIGAVVTESVDRRVIRAHLRSRAINAHTLWGDALSVSRMAADAWGTDLVACPKTALLADMHIHFPINRFMTSRDVGRPVDACAELMKAGSP